MSGGHFNYVQDRIKNEVFDKLAEEIALNKVQLSWVDREQWINEYNRSRWKPETIREFRKGLKKIKEAYVYIQRIDWLLSGDDGEETFHKRLKEELKKC